MGVDVMSKDALLELLERFRELGICHDSKSKRFQDVLDFQDWIGRRTYSGIGDEYSKLDRVQKETFLWATFSCMSIDVALEVLESTVIGPMFNHFIKVEEDELSKKWMKLHMTEITFKGYKKAIYKKFASLNCEVKYWKDKFLYYERRVQELTSHRGHLMRKLKTKDAEIEDIRRGLDRYLALKKSIKEMIDE